MECGHQRQSRSQPDETATRRAADALLEAVAELRALFPDWRFGQLVSNLALAAGRDGALWDVDDAELLASARRLLARNESRTTITV